MTRAAPATVAALWLVLTPLAIADLPEIQERTTLRVLVVPEMPRREFFSLDPATPGFDREILEAFARLHRLRLEVVALTSWDHLIPALLDGRGDMIAGGCRDTEARRKFITFTSEVFPTRIVLVTRRPRPLITTLEQLQTEKVGTMKGTAMADALTAARVPFEEIPAGSFAESLRTGRVGVVAWSVERAIPGQREDPALQLGMFLGKPGILAFGVRKQDTRLLAALNAYLDNFRKAGAWSRLTVKYFGEGALGILKQARSE